MKEEGNGIGSVFAVLAGYVLSATAFTLGGSIGNGLDFAGGLTAIITGNIILALYAGVMGYLCYKTRKNAGETYKPVFGKKGSVLAVSVAGLFVILFCAVYCALVGNMTNAVFPGAPKWVGIAALFIFMTITTAINMTGFKGISYFGKFAIPAILVFVVYGLIMIEKVNGFSNVLEAAPQFHMPVFAGISLVCASWMTGATISPDITRFVKKPGYIFIVTFAAFMCVAGLESAGMFLSLASGESDMVSALSVMGLGGAAYVLYLLLTLSSGAPSIMLVCISVINIFNIFPKQAEKAASGNVTAKTFIIPLSIVSTAGGLFLMLSNFTTTFIGIINVIGTAIPPIGGVVISHYLVIQSDFKKAFENMPDYNTAAFAAWGAGTAIGALVNWGIAALNGFFAAGALYALISIAAKKKKGCRLT
ncbi:MAG: cytosine permease [Clostridiales bacterium]|nr:cytosine permease [Clostridiales bacterium]